MSFRDAEVVELLLGNCVPVKINSELLATDLAGSYGVRSYPGYVVLAADGEELGRWSGYLKPAELADKLRELLAAGEKEKD